MVVVVFGVIMLVSIGIVVWLCGVVVVDVDECVDVGLFGISMLVSVGIEDELVFVMGIFC